MDAFWRNSSGMAKGVFFAVLLALPLVVKDKFLLDTMVLIFLWGAMGGAWNIVGGYAGQLSIGHAVFYGVGAYSTALCFMKLGISPWFGSLIGGLLSVLAALIVGLISIRLRGPFFALATLALVEIAMILALKFRGLTAGAEGLSVPFKPGFQYLMFSEKWKYAYVALGLMILVYLITVLIERSRLGLYLVALREDHEAAEAVGVPTLWSKLLAFCISAFLTSLCGSFYVLYINYIDPYNTFSIMICAEGILMVMVGGMATTMGPILGSFLLTSLAQFLRAWMGGGLAGLHMLIYAIILILVALFMPHGLVKEFERRTKKIFRLGGGM